MEPTLPIESHPRNRRRQTQFTGEVVEAPLVPPGDEQVLIRNDFLGLASSARLRMGEEPSYSQPLALGDVIYGQAVGQVVESRAASLREGDMVMSVRGGWQQYSVAAASGLVKVDPAVAPPSV